MGLLRAIAPNPLCGASTLSNWMRLLRNNFTRMHWSRYPSAAAISFVTTFGLPFRVWESLRFRRKVERQDLGDDPVLIIGHWRSGTTHLHNMLLHDDRFGYVTLLQCLLPNFFLVRHNPFRWLMEQFIPSRRPMDSVPVGLEEPMSEDFMLAGMTDLSHYTGYVFPNNLEEIFRRTILFEGVSPRDIARWKRVYAFALKKVSLAAGGKRLLLKNPANTGRIPTLLQLYPQAKFIHVTRNPFEVYASSCRLMDKFVNIYSLQRCDFEQMHRAVLRRQRLLDDRYRETRSLIPEGNLIEIRFEDLVDTPLQTVQAIYETLRLGEFDAMRPRLEKYLTSIADYKRNRYEFDAETLAAIKHELGEMIRRDNYIPPEVTDEESSNVPADSKRSVPSCRVNA